MTDLRELLEQAAGPAPPPLPAALVRGRAEERRRRRRRLAAGLVAAAAAAAAVVVPWSAAPPPDPAAPPRVRQVGVGPLPAGRYTGRVADVPVTFTIPRGAPWTATRVTPDDLTLTEPGLPLQIDVTRWTAVHTYDPEGVALRRTQPVPADLVQWLRKHPALAIVGPVTPTRLAGRPAHQLEVVINAGYAPLTAPSQAAPQPCALLEDCITLGTTAEGPVFLNRRSILILVVTDAPTEQRLVAMAVITTHVDARPATSTAQQLLDSFAPAP